MAAGNTECNTELCLTAGGCQGNNTECRRAELSCAVKPAGARAEKKQAFTMFYGGRVCICDATEIQARAIISMATSVEEAMRRNVRSSPSWSEAAPATIRLETHPLNWGLSLKKSLQGFLQKRKRRVFAITQHQHQKKRCLLQEAADSSSFS